VGNQLSVLGQFGLKLHTVVALGNAILDSSTLRKVGDLGPVFIGIGRAAESTAGSMGGDLPRRRGSRVGVALARHDEGELGMRQSPWG
jgi:hypothetical protein